MNAYFVTFGCKVNQYETQAMMQQLQRCGYHTAEWTEGTPCDGETVIVVNSCTVTGESDRKLRQALHRLRRCCPQAVLVLSGCFPQAFPQKAQALTEADIVLGNACRDRLPQLLQAYRETGRQIVAVASHPSEYEEKSIRCFEGRTRAFIKIEDGCNRFCSYCIIPYARGRVRSKPLAALREETEQLAAGGYREIVLVGINLTAYGQDLGLNLADAVETVCAVPGILRVRLGSLEPDFMTDAVIRRLAHCEQLCPQFHIALQSGCDATLRRMNRRYDCALFENLCRRLRAVFPDGTLTTDIMVGCPGETAADFEQSLAFCEKIGFARMHVFAYSVRPGTVAAGLPDQVPAAEKALRSRRMGACAAALAEKAAASLVGRTVQILVETRQKDGAWEGYTPGYIPVRLYRKDVQPGTVIPVKITGHVAGICLAE